MAEKAPSAASLSALREGTVQVLLLYFCLYCFVPIFLLSFIHFFVLLQGSHPKLLIDVGFFYVCVTQYENPAVQCREVTQSSRVPVTSNRKGQRGDRRASPPSAVISLSAALSAAEEKNNPDLSACVYLESHRDLYFLKKPP